MGPNKKGNRNQIITTNKPSKIQLGRQTNFFFFFFEVKTGGTEQRRKEEETSPRYLNRHFSGQKEAEAKAEAEEEEEEGSQAKKRKTERKKEGKKVRKKAEPAKQLLWYFRVESADLLVTRFNKSRHDFHCSKETKETHGFYTLNK